MYFQSTTAVAALASLHLVSAAIVVPWNSSYPAPVPAPAPSGISQPRVLPPVDRDSADEDFQEFHLKDDDDHKVWASLEQTFSIINEIPDDVLQSGDDETHKWLVDHGYRGASPKPRSRRDILSSSSSRGASSGVQELATRGIFDVVRCAGAIAAFVASNAIGAAKIFRIKKYIEALGGFRKSAELLLKASNNAERLKEGGEALALLASEILGVPLITNNC